MLFISNPPLLGVGSKSHPRKSYLENSFLWSEKNHIQIFSARCMSAQKNIVAFWYTYKSNLNINKENISHDWKTE